MELVTYATRVCKIFGVETLIGPSPDHSLQALIPQRLTLNG